VLAAVEVAAESHTFVVNFVDFGEAEDLKAAGIGQHRAVPAHEFMQAAHVTHEIIAGAQVEVIGIRQHQRRADLMQIARGDSLDRCLRADWGEHRGQQIAVRRMKYAGAGAILRFDRLEIK
jgi:hypothetical protein